MKDLFGRYVEDEGYYSEESLDFESHEEFFAEVEEFHERNNREEESESSPLQKESSEESVHPPSH